ncbi:MAG: helix-turn-helix domain-containing protein [Pyrinomonadaceae bacterium]
MANRRDIYRGEERLSDKTLLETSNLTDVVESLTKALDTLESLKEVEVYQLLRLHAQYFPKKGIDFYKVTKLYEKSLIEHALREAKGKQTEAAKLLNLGLSTLNAKIKKHKISI